MITNFQCLVTLFTLRESGKNVLPYSDGISQILSSRIPLENKAIIKESSVKQPGLEKNVLCNHYLSKKTSENKMHIQNKMNFVMDFHPNPKVS